MTGLYDKIGKRLPPGSQDKNLPLLEELTQRLEEDEKSGITPLDLVSLQGIQKQIMLFMLRDPEAVNKGIPYNKLSEALSTKDHELAKALEALARQGWLLILGEPPNLSYKVYMRRKRGSNLGLGIWSLLSQRLPANKDNS